MNKKVWCIISIIAVCLFAFNIGFAEDEKSVPDFQNLDKEHEGIYYNSDAVVFKYMIEKFEIDETAMEQLIEYFNGCNDPGIKAYITYFLPQAYKKATSDIVKYKVIDLLNQAMFEGVFNKKISDPAYASKSWRVRFVAVDSAVKICKETDEQGKDKICQHLLLSLMKDDEERVRGASALALGVCVPILNENRKNHYIWQMNFRLSKAPFEDQYFIACLVKALGEIGDKSSFWYLMEERRKAHTDYVQKQIFISMEKISYKAESKYKK